MPADITVTELVDEFVATLRQYGLRIDRPVVEREIRERVSVIARTLHVDEPTVLREQARTGWGQHMAVAVIAQIEREGLLDPIPAAPAHSRSRQTAIGR